MNRILITGATGFLGSHLCRRFLQEGFSVGIVIRPTSNTWRINDVLDRLEVFDLGTHSIGNIVSQFKPNHIIHTACDYGRKDSSLSKLVDTNISFPIHLLEAAISNKVETFVNTDTLLPENVNEYSLSKAQFRNWLESKSSEIAVINLKLEHMYGPKDDENKFVFWLIRQLTDDSVHGVPLTSGVQKRDFIYIDDVVDAFLITVQNKTEGYHSFDVATDHCIEVKEFVTVLVKQLELKAKEKYFHKLKFGEKSYRKGELMNPELDNSLLKEIGWSPKVSLDNGIANIISGLK